MTRTCLVVVDDVTAVDAPRTPLTLADLRPGASARVSRVALDTGDAEWLRAVGVAVGETVTLLRRAALGGPLHVRTSSGGEFAVDRSLARSITLDEVSDGAPG